VPAWLSDLTASEHGRTAFRDGVGMPAGRIFGPYGAIATPILLYAAERVSTPGAGPPGR
jgi:hypothetical protein